MLDFCDAPTVAVCKVWKRYLVDRSRSEDVGKRKKAKKNTTLVESLKDVSFVTEAGESVGIIGQNGSGKSTLLKLIAQAEAVSEGEIYVKTRPTLLGVSPALQPYLSGEQNIYLGCLAIGMSKKEAQEQVPRIAEWSEIGEAVKRPMRTYSAGQSARLIFAISTAIRPEILLVDEALSTGDAAFAKRAEKRMSDLLSGAGNLFLVSHSTQQIAANCSRVIWLDDGMVVGDGPSEQLLPLYDQWSAATADEKYEEAEALMKDVSIEFPQQELISLKELESAPELNERSQEG